MGGVQILDTLSEGCYHGAVDNQQLSKNFKLQEFNWVVPRPELLYILQFIRDLDTVSRVDITDSAREVRDHIQTYKNIAARQQKQWQDIITWKSRHLPSHKFRDLRAVDFKVTHTAQFFLQGPEVEQLIKDCRATEEFKGKFGEVHFGIGVGRQYVHMDTGDRGREARWTYGY